MRVCVVHERHERVGVHARSNTAKVEQHLSIYQTSFPWRILCFYIHFLSSGFRSNHLVYQRLSRKYIKKNIKECIFTKPDL